MSKKASKKSKKNVTGAKDREPYPGWWIFEGIPQRIYGEPTWIEQYRRPRFEPIDKEEN